MPRREEGNPSSGIVRAARSLPRRGKRSAAPDWVRLHLNASIRDNPPMTQPGMLWRHVVINTHGTWLHGDERGFRSRGHRIHSSGDYRNPPPREEHADLRQYHRNHCPNEVTIPRNLRPRVGQAFRDYLLDEKYRVLCVAVGKVHAHAVVELPKDIRRVKRIIGEAKRFASCTVTSSIPGALWSAGGEFVPVTRADHLKSAYEYDLYKQGPGAWTWSWRDKSREGTFARKRPVVPAPQRNQSGAAQRLPRRGK